MYIVVVDYDKYNRVTKYQDYQTKPEAEAHINRIKEQYPKAFVSKDPGGGYASWLVDPKKQIIRNSPHVEGEKELQYKEQAKADTERMKKAVLNTGLNWASLENSMSFLLESIITKSNYQLGFAIYFSVASADSRFSIVDKAITSVFQVNKHSERLIKAWTDIYYKLKKAKEKRNKITHGQIIPVQKKRYGKIYVRLTPPLFSKGVIGSLGSAQLPGMSLHDVEEAVESLQTATSLVTHLSMLFTDIHNQNEKALLEKLGLLEKHIYSLSLPKRGRRIL